MYKLQPDGTHTLFQVKYDLNYDSYDESGDDYECDVEDVEYWMPLPKEPKQD